MGNHHDFLETEKRNNENSMMIGHPDYAVYPLSRASRDPAEEVIGVDWIKRAHRNYKQMKLASIQVPTGKKV